MNILFDIKLTFKQVFMCESCPLKRAFLKATNAAAGMLVSNASELTKTFTLNLFDGLPAIIPYAFIVFAGFVCSDKSPCNNKAKGMRSSMQQGQGQTSMTFELLLAYQKLAPPVIITLENVKERMCVDLESAYLTDLTYVLAQLRSIGYGFLTHFVIKAEAFGSAAVRIRIYIVGVRCPITLKDNASFLIQVKRSMSDARK